MSKTHTFQSTFILLKIYNHKWPTPHKIFKGEFKHVLQKIKIISDRGLLKMTRDIEYLQYHSRYLSQNFKRNVASYTPTGTVTEMNIWIDCDLFYIVLNKNWNYLVVWTIKLSFTGLGQENRCSSYSVVYTSPAFLRTDTTL